MRIPAATDVNSSMSSSKGCPDAATAPFSSDGGRFETEVRKSHKMKKIIISDRLLHQFGRDNTVEI